MHERERPIEWAELCTLSCETEAHLLQGALESAGLPCALESLVFHAEPVSFGALGKVRVHVPRERVAEAEAVLEELRSANRGPDPEP